MRAEATALDAPRGGGGPAESALSAKVRVRYAKTGKLRFISAIDLGRIWERALRKADVPIAYSEGFSPHPKVSFPDALPLGYASTGEYAELSFAVPIEVDSAMTALNAAFPDGLEVLASKAVRDGEPRLSKWLLASWWDIAYPAGTDTARLEAAAAGALAAEEVPVARERKGEAVEIDLRPALHHLTVLPDHLGSSPLVRVVLHHVEPPVRPTEVQLALDAFDPHDSTNGDALPPPTLVTRVAQGTPCADGLVEALTGDPVTARPAGPAP